ncbi:histidinol-phosphate transaminase [Muriicola sp. Z0-33]|uniref:histidinol-phosphate transaminase n=1 Tax=Muriicola sp. Z0-33 TaxID=2816957 RepID=UPI002237E56D|nr:histidinol-phosphate transaminase [Muriicola sp. Z0-33]MCW5516722.1 histidinol-phosphate transaminase [Muriicola sp. Z0-33]
MKSNFNIDALVRENVKSLQPYSSARDEFKASWSEDLVFLDANENPFENGVNRYPDPQQHILKSKMAEIKNIETAQMLLGNGSDEVLDLLFRAFCEPNEDNVITMPPTYGMYGVLAGINAVENRTVFLTDDFEPNTDEILKKVDSNTKIIFICSPNNPTANSFSDEIVAEIIEKFNGLVVIDEAYIDFSEHESWTRKLSSFPNLVVTQTLSKAYGMAGIRLGICMASEEIINILNKIKPPYNVNELTQTRALEQISNPELIAAEVADILRERKLLIKALEPIGCIEHIFDTDANFLLVRVDDAQKRYIQLIEMGIVVRNRSKQPLCNNTLRFTVGTPSENKRLISTLKALD